MNPSQLHEGKVTFIHSVFKPKECTPIGVHEIIDKTRSGEWERDIHAVRLVLHRSRQAYDLEKPRKLPAILWAGVFTCADDANLKTHSGLTCLDVDHIPRGEADRLKGEFAKLNCVRAVFISPSGQGLKIVVRIECPSPTDHKRITKAVAADMAAKVPLPSGAKFDNTHDLSRKCFASWDPHLHDNPHAVPWDGCFTERQRDRETEETEKPMLLYTPSPSPPPHVGKDGSAPPRSSVRELLAKHAEAVIPSRVHDTFKRLFILAQLTVAYGEEHHVAVEQCAGVFFAAWYEMTRERDASFLTNTRSDYECEFLEKIPKVKVPFGRGGIDEAVRRMAETDPPPIAAIRFPDSAPIGRLLHLCQTLGAMQPPGTPFYLSSREAEKVVGVSHTLANRYLRAFVVNGILVEVEKPDIAQRKASRFRWNGDLPTK
jgi:hypothetical protein